MRKPLHILLVLAMTASLLATAAVGAFAQTFTDVDETNTFFDEIENVNAEGILTGFEQEDGSFEFRPGLDLPRRAAAAAIYRLAGEPEGDWAEFAADRFTDRDGTGQFDDAIGWAVQAGIISGFDEGDGTRTFRAGQDVSRAAWAVWLYGLQGSPADQDYAQIAADAFVDRDGTGQFDAAVGWASANEIITGYELEDGTFEYRGPDTIKRRAVAAMASRYFEEFGKGFVEGRIDATFTVLNADLDTPEADEQGTLLLSTGEDLVSFVFDTDRDSFFIDGEPAAVTAVVALLTANLEDASDAAVTIDVAGSATNGYDHDFSVETLTTGVVGGIDGTLLDTSTFFLTDFPSGIQLTSEYAIGDAEVYVVDGAAANEDRFTDDISVGDIIEIVFNDDDEVDEFRLTNNDPTGVPAYIDGDTIGVDVYGNADFPVVDPAEAEEINEIPGHIFAEVTGDDYSVTLNGEDADEVDSWVAILDLVDAFIEGDAYPDDTPGESFFIDTLEVTYDRDDAEVILDAVAETTEFDPQFEAFSGIALTGDNVDSGDGEVTVIVSDDADDNRTMSFTDDTTFRVGGLIVPRSDFADELTLGDEVTCLAGELDDATDAFGDVTCTSMRVDSAAFSAQVIAGAEGDNLFTIELANGYELGVTPEIATEPLGFAGDDVGFTANGAAVYEVEEGDDVYVILQFIADAIAATNLDVSTVTISLNEDGVDDLYDGAVPADVLGTDLIASTEGEYDADFVWDFDGFPASVINGIVDDAQPVV